MILSVVVIVLLLGVAFFHYIQGLFSATISAILAVIAAVLAIGCHETIVESILGGAMADKAHSMVLLVSFAAFYLIPRVLIDSLVPGNLRLPALADKLGGAVMGLIAGTFASGVVALAAQELPVGPSVWGYSRFKVEDKQDIAVPSVNGTRNPTRQLYEALSAYSFDEARSQGDQQTLLFPADEIVLGVVRKLSEGGSLSGSQELSHLHPDWPTEAFGQRLGIEPGAKRVAVNVGKEEQVKLEAVYQLPTNLAQKDGDFLVVRPKAPPATQPINPTSSKQLFAVRLRFEPNAADKEGEVIRFSTGAVRLVTKGREDGGAEQVWKNYFPIGTLDSSANVIYTQKPDDFLFIKNVTSTDNKAPGVDLVFAIDADGFIQNGKKGLDAGKAKLTDGTFVEFKRLARIDLSNGEVKTAKELKPDGGLAMMLRKAAVATVTAVAAAPTDLGGAPGPTSDDGRKFLGEWEQVVGAGVVRLTITDSTFTIQGQNAFGSKVKAATGSWREAETRGAGSIVVRVQGTGPDGKTDIDDWVVNFEGDTQIKLASNKGADPVRSLRKKDGAATAQTPTPPTPPTPTGNVPKATFALDVTDIQVNPRFFAPVGIPANAADGQRVTGAGGMAYIILAGGKINSITLSPAGVEAMKGTANQVSDLAVPEGQTMVQVSAAVAAGATGNPWVWTSQTDKIALVDDKGNRYTTVGVWAGFDDPAGQKVTGIYHAPTKGGIKFPPVAIPKVPPTVVTFAFLVPTGTVIKDVRLGDASLKPVDNLTAQ